MLMDLIFLAIGLTIGWFFLPRPQWAVNLMAKLAVKMPFLAPFVPAPATPPTPPVL